MSDCGFVLSIDPFIVEAGWLRLSWYGFTYSLGFLGIWLWLDWRRGDLGWSRREVLDFAILFAASVLVGGRLFEVVFYEWHYYRDHLLESLAYWHGGLSSHGLMAGAAVAILLFARAHGMSFFAVADRIVVPAALFLGIGRIGNFLEGGVIGYPTDLPWSVQMPDVSGCRHPVALYDSLKNFALIPLLLWVLRRHPAGSGLATAHFLFWYGGGRFLVDIFRDYETGGFPPGQYFNLLTAALGFGLILWLSWRPARPRASRTVPADAAPGRVRVVLFLLLALFPLLIPRSWTEEALTEMRREQGTLATPPAEDGSQ